MMVNNKSAKSRMKCLWSDWSYLGGNCLAGLRKTAYKLRMLRVPAEVGAGHPVNAVHTWFRSCSRITWCSDEESAGCIVLIVGIRNMYVRFSRETPWRNHFTVVWMMSWWILKKKGVNWIQVVSITARPLYPQERPGTHCIGSWMGPRVGLDGCGKSRPYRDSIPGPFS